MKADEPILYVDKVTFSWPCGTNALDKCNLSIPRPGLWMIVGSNGSGKSTLFRLIHGILKPREGCIYCNLKSALMYHQLLLPTCGSDLLLSLSSQLSSSECSDRIRSAMAQVGMAGLESRPIHTLSGGQKQRLALAGALASEAKLLLLDEPTALLDPTSQDMVLQIVQQLSRRSKDPITALWITHRLQELEHCDAAALMERGRVGKWQAGHLLMNRLMPLAVRQG